jgi:hypothetical protein
MLFGGTEEAAEYDRQTRETIDAAYDIPAEVAVELVCPGPPGKKSFVKDVLWDQVLGPTKDWLADKLGDLLNPDKTKREKNK